MDPLPFFSTCIIIFLAELGDKTQLLTMAFAAQYKIRDILTSVLAASALLMFIAVLFGRAIYVSAPVSTVQLIAGGLFLIFGLWVLKSDEDKKLPTFSKNSFFTVFVAFLLAEIGDKTQFAAVALAVKFNAPFEVWAGAIAGMFAANGIGILVGNRVRAYLPQKIVKRIVAGLFFVFGAITIYGSL